MMCILPKPCVDIQPPTITFCGCLTRYTICKNDIGSEQCGDVLTALQRMIRPKKLSKWHKKG